MKSGLHRVRATAAVSSVLVFVFITGILRAAEADLVVESMAAFKAHVAGERTLTDEQIQAHTRTFADNVGAMSGSEDAIRACVDFVGAYDANVGTMFSDTPQLNSKEPKGTNALHWAAFRVMQALLDKVYNNEGLAAHGELLGSVKFATADYFPGNVEGAVDPEPYAVKIRADYPETWGSPLIYTERPARKPTGAYLAPGTVATVTVPTSMVGKGYQVRVGAQSWDLSGKPRVNRLYRVTTLYDINTTEVSVANPLGGGIYIEVPYKAEGKVETVIIRNAVRSPYFSWKSFHRTSLEDWQKVERHRKAPWADFQTDKFMMQVPTSWIYALEDPVSLMKNWDEAMDICCDLMGRPRLYGREILYTQVDTQLRGRALHPGYPAGNRGYDPAKDYGGNHWHHLVRGPQFAHHYELHELGHGLRFPEYAGDVESGINLLHAAVMNKGYGLTFDQALRSSLTQSNEFITLENAAVAWMMSENFIKDGVMLKHERQYQVKGHAKFVDIARLFGWDALGRFWRAGQEAFMAGTPWPRRCTREGDDLYTVNLSKATGADLRPLIHFWGIPTVDDEASDAMIKDAGIKPSRQVYDLLMTYKRCIPADNAAFREYALKWWGKQPSTEGYRTQSNHAAYWDSYDEEQATKVHETVQAILDRYFPDGRPEEGDGGRPPADMPSEVGGPH